MKKTILLIVACILLSVPSWAEEQGWCAGGLCDIYGGRIDMPCTSASGFFELVLVNRIGGGQRWMMCTPANHLFQPIAMQVLDVAGFSGGTAYGSRINVKFGTDRSIGFCPKSVQQIRTWNFSMMGPFWNSHCSPTGNTDDTSPLLGEDRMPYAWIMQVPSQATKAGQCRGDVSVPERFKNLNQGVDTAVFSAGGNTLDFFNRQDADNQLENCADAEAQFLEDFFSPGGGLGADDWAVYIYVGGDLDFLRGFGPSDEFPNVNGAIHQHLSWVIAFGCPNQTNASADCGTGGFSYTDTEVYSKTEFLGWLQNSCTGISPCPSGSPSPNYANIGALNTAWGTSYVGFTIADDPGGDCVAWPDSTASTSGDGCLKSDNGAAFASSSCWNNLNCMNATMKSDFNAFLRYTAHYFFLETKNAVHGIIRSTMLTSSLDPLGGNGGARRDIIRGTCDAGLDMNTVQFDFRHDIAPLDGNSSNNAVDSRTAILDAYYDECALPMMFWTSFNSQADSEFVGNTSALESVDYDTQEERGDAYKAAISGTASGDIPNGLWNHDCNASGVYCAMGPSWFEYAGRRTDTPGCTPASEKTNWGMVSTCFDNRYDGVHSVTAAVNCQAPEIDELIIAQPACGGETAASAPFGDFIGRVTDANDNWIDLVLNTASFSGNVKFQGNVKAN